MCSRNTSSYICISTDCLKTVLPPQNCVGGCQWLQSKLHLDSGGRLLIAVDQISSAGLGVSCISYSQPRSGRLMVWVCHALAIASPDRGGSWCAVVS